MRKATALAAAASAHRGPSLRRTAEGESAVAPALRSEDSCYVPPDEWSHPASNPVDDEPQIQARAGCGAEQHRVGDDDIDVVVMTPTECSHLGPQCCQSMAAECAQARPSRNRTGRTLAQELGAVVVSPNYRLAPETLFPQGLTTVWLPCSGWWKALTSWGSTRTASPCTERVQAVACRRGRATRARRGSLAARPGAHLSDARRSDRLT